MKARELKELKSSNPQDLTVKLGDLKAELFNLRFHWIVMANEIQKAQILKSILETFQF
jgi:large subunit ribosomal protein L29